MKYMITYYREFNKTTSIDTTVVEWDSLSEANIKKFCTDYKFLESRSPAAILNIIKLDD